jgi:phage-related protein
MEGKKREMELSEEGREKSRVKCGRGGYRNRRPEGIKKSGRKKNIFLKKKKKKKKKNLKSYVVTMCGEKYRGAKEKKK